MFVIYGTRLYGKVDHVPGLFYVATTFFHINFVPLIPTGSYLIMDDGSEENGVQMNFHFRSAFFGWARAAGFIAGVIMPFIGMFDKQMNPASRWMTALIGLGILLATIASYWYVCIGRDRAAQVAAYAGLNPNFVHDHFDRLTGETPTRRVNDDAIAGLDYDDAVRRWNPNKPHEN